MGAKKHLFLFVLLTITFLFCSAAEEEYDVRNMGYRSGLRNEITYSIIQDKRGYIWIGTDNGIFRYDGNQFLHINASNSPIISNTVNSLYYEPEKDRMWIGTALGLFVMDVPAIEIKPAVPEIIPDNVKTYNIVSIKKGESNTIWFVNRHNNILRYDTKTDKISVFNSANTKNLGDSFWDVEEDDKGNLLVGTDGEGVKLLDYSKRKVTEFRNNPGEPERIAGNTINTLYKDHAGYIWIGSTKGLSVYNPASRSFVTHHHRAQEPVSLPNDNIQSILELNNGNLWLGHPDGGISIIYPADIAGTIAGIPNFNDISSVLPSVGADLNSREIHKIFQDRFNNVWIGYSNGGIDFIGHGQRLFNIVGKYSGHERLDDVITSLFPIRESRHRMWLGSEGKIILYEPGKALERYRIPEAGKIHSIYDTGNGTLLLGHEKGLSAYNLKTKTGKTFNFPLGTSAVYAIAKIRESEYILGTSDGVYLFNGSTVSKIPQMSQTVKSFDCYSILMDSYNRIWIATHGDGVFVYDSNFRLIKHLNESTHTLTTSSIRHIYQDSRGWIWIGGKGGITCVKDLNNLSDNLYYNNLKDLGTPHVRAINEDIFGNIWFSTTTGMSRLEKNTRRINNYDYRQGIPASTFMDAVTAQDSDGNIYFGALAGLCVFNPKTIDAMDSPTPVNITEIQFPENLNYDGKIVPADSVEGRFELPYDRNSFTVRFVMPDHYLAENMEYAYMMDGLDTIWIPIGNENAVQFHNLPPGKYNFRVRARLRNQDWDDAVLSCAEIVVNPPLWLTWWAKALYVIIACALIYFALRYFYKRLKNKDVLELERRESEREKEINEERLRFFTNITHELRTPLTLIISPLEDLVADKSINEKQRHCLNLIHKNSLRLLNLVNQLLEFRKTETQNRVLKVEKGNLNTLVTEIGLRFKELNRNTNIDINVDTRQDIEDFFFDPEVVRIIVNNFLSNALKYTRAGHITLSVKAADTGSDRRVTIEVADTGIGIPTEAIPHIFERYYQAKRDSHVSGTGIGLALVKSLSDLHGGEVTVESVEGKGSVFRFSLRMDNTYPQALHSEPADKSDSGTDAAAEQKDTRPCILVVEDDDDIRRYIADSFNEDYRVVTAGDGAEALEKARTDIPDIIISDVMMPIMDGVSLCRTIKSDVSTSHIPVILLTAKDSLRDKEEGYECGADSYLTKPFTAKLLKNRIQNILESRKKLSEFFMKWSVKPDHAPVTASDVSKEPDITVNKLDEEFMNRLNAIIQEHISDDQLSMEMIQNKMNMSYSTFYRKIKALTGISGNEYIRKIRLSHVKKLLDEGYSVSEAAWSSGFNDLVYFRKCFKKEFGATPSEYSRPTEQPQ